MRYYKIQIDDGILPLQIWSSLIVSSASNFIPPSVGVGATNPGALNIEFDMMLTTAQTAGTENVNLRIWGAGLDLINKAAQYNGKYITVEAGMMRGLPLANAQVNAPIKRNGQILTGTIKQAYGNWQGVDQTLDFIIMAGGNPNTTALQTTESSGTISVLPNGNVTNAAIGVLQNSLGIKNVTPLTSLLIAPNGLIFKFDGVIDFAQQLNKQTIPLMGNNLANPYTGLQIYNTSEMCYLYDNYNPSGNPKAIEFADLVGQPTWLGLLELQIKTILRSDINTGDTIDLNALINSSIPSYITVKSQAWLKNNIAFNGLGFVQSVRHVGNFRQPDGNSWVSIITVALLS